MPSTKTTRSHQAIRVEAGSRSALAEKLLHGLQAEASSLGMRLKPESELAAALGVKLRTLRLALRELERDGIVIRRRGSGTYLRRLPEATVESTQAEAMVRQAIGGSLFAENQNPEVGSRVLASQDVKNFVFELWGNLHCTTSCNQAILSSISAELSHHGHRLSVHSLGKPGGELALNPGTVGKDCDGYIVAAGWAEYFETLLEKEHAPILYFHPGSLTHVERDPMVLIDTAEAVRRAINDFIKRGIRKVGVLGLLGSGRDPDAELDAYHFAMSRADLDYRWVHQCNEELSEVIDAVLEMLESPDRPDALYVTDNVLLPGVAQALRAAKVIPGKDIAIITHNNKGEVLPRGYDWSSLEFNLDVFGRLIARQMLAIVEDGKSVEASLAIHPVWHPGITRSLEY